MTQVAAIIAAAGKGARIGLKTPKPFLLLEGEAVLARTITVFQRHPRIGLIQPVIPRRHLSLFNNRLYKKYRWSKCLPPVAGGRERQDSVFYGLSTLPEDVEMIVIHDGARPLLSHDLLNRVLKAASRFGAALAAIPIQDTVKKVSLNNLVEDTVDRRNLWLAQTPQAFRANLLREAYSLARTKNIHSTDDAALVESLGHQVHIVPGSPWNLKITTRDDLALARVLVREADY